MKIVPILLIFSVLSPFVWSKPILSSDEDNSVVTPQAIIEKYETFPPEASKEFAIKQLKYFLRRVESCSENTKECRDRKKAVAMIRKEMSEKTWGKKWYQKISEKIKQRLSTSTHFRVYCLWQYIVPGEEDVWDWDDENYDEALFPDLTNLSINSDI